MRGRAASIDVDYASTANRGALVSFVASVDWSFTASPMPPSERSSGLARQGPRRARAGRRPHGARGRRVRAGRLAAAPRPLVRGGAVRARGRAAPRARRARPLGWSRATTSLIPIGLWHALGNGGPSRFAGSRSTRRSRLGPDAGRKDTFFAREPFDLAAFAARAARPSFGSPTLRWVGHYDGTPPQAEALRLDDPARGRRPAGMDTALARLQRDHREDARRPRVRRRPADDVHGRLRARRRRPGARPSVRGDVLLPVGRDRGRARRPAVHDPGRATSCSPASGSVHGFYNTGTERVRWIETQAPQPPVRHAYRWVPSWKQFEEDNDVG